MPFPPSPSSGPTPVLGPPQLPWNCSCPGDPRGSLTYSFNKHYLSGGCTEAHTAQAPHSRSSGWQGGSGRQRPQRPGLGREAGPSPVGGVMTTSQGPLPSRRPSHLPAPSLSLPRPHLSPWPPGAPARSASILSPSMPLWKWPGTDQGLLNGDQALRGPPPGLPLWPLAKPGHP